MESSDTESDYEPTRQEQTLALSRSVGAGVQPIEFNTNTLYRLGITGMTDKIPRSNRICLECKDWYHSCPCASTWTHPLEYILASTTPSDQYILAPEYSLISPEAQSDFVNSIKMIYVVAEDREGDYTISSVNNSTITDFFNTMKGKEIREMAAPTDLFTFSGRRSKAQKLDPALLPHFAILPDYFEKYLDMGELFQGHPLWIIWLERPRDHKIKAFLAAVHSLLGMEERDLIINQFAFAGYSEAVKNQSRRYNGVDVWQKIQYGTVLLIFVLKGELRLKTAGKGPLPIVRRGQAIILPSKLYNSVDTAGHATTVTVIA